ncbi:MAG: formylglycine-generating enzyme family protein [bacterium]|nr:formylglycine-generating enzyme family protein [bacterium]
MVMVRICPGTFTMGSADDGRWADDDEKPAHQVTVSEFWIGNTEVTNEQYRQVHPDHRPAEPGDLPATYVSWRDAQEFCQSAGYRLPTEAEWEYAARAGTQTPWSFGANEADIGRFAWHVGNTGGEPHAAGTLEPNPWHLHDMHGNVWEWVADVYGPFSDEPQTDPKGPELGSNPADDVRVVRGGSCLLGPWSVRSADRSWNGSVYRVSDFGFRCVRGPRRQP